LLVYSLLFPGQRPLTPRDVNDVVAAHLASATAPPARSALVYRAVQPSLVLIQTTRPGAADDAGGLGTGVVVSAAGDILTSLHVVADAQDILVTFADGSESSAFLIGAQPENDIAVLQPINPPFPLVPATLGNPNALRVGDEAFVVGNPFGLYSSMSAGVVSGLKRSFQPADGRAEMDDLIQVDAAVNPGNSGGPLVNRFGEVVGIVVALVNPTEQDVFIGIGFAVPIDVAGAAAGMPLY
jgi:S1-C subfamily serine protease